MAAMSAFCDVVDVAAAHEENARLAALILDEARRQGMTLGCAESCTGGLIAGALTDIPGSSDVFKGGIVSYWEQVKISVLGVEPDVLATDGVVSGACAEQMAAGAREVLGCDIAVSTTGIAGPGGAEPGKPVGMVWFGVASPQHVSSKVAVFSGGRSQVRISAVRTALEIFSETLRQGC